VTLPALPEAESDILVPLPLMPSEGCELLLKLVQAFGTTPQHGILVRPHPMSTVEGLLTAAGLRELPAHFRTTQIPMGDLLVRTRLVIGLSSSSVFEALAAGVPVLSVGRETALNLDPLGFHPEGAGLFHDPDEIRQEAERLLNLPEAGREALRRRGREILAESFAPVTEEGLRAFLPETNATLDSFPGQGPPADGKPPKPHSPPGDSA
jgi:hypothetical protein